MEVTIVNTQNTKVGTIKVDDQIFGRPVNIHLLHEAVRMQLNNQHLGTHATKTRGMVRGGGKKPWRQKGTGRARAGSIRSPIWVGGGTVFGPRPRDYSYSIPRKKMRLALYTAFSSKIKENTFIVVDSLNGYTGKTKEVVNLLKNLNIDGSVIIVCEDKNNLIYRGARNIENVVVMDSRQLNVYDVLKYKYLIISKDDLVTLMDVWKWK